MYMDALKEEARRSSPHIISIYSSPSIYHYIYFPRNKVKKNCYAYYHSSPFSPGSCQGRATCTYINRAEESVYCFKTYLHHRYLCIWFHKYIYIYSVRRPFITNCNNTIHIDAGQNHLSSFRQFAARIIVSLSVSAHRNRLAKRPDVKYSYIHIYMFM